MSDTPNTGEQPPVVAPAAVQSVVVRAPPPPPPPGWQFDKTIGVAVIVAVIAQLVVGIWYAAGAYSQLADHEKRIVHLEQQFEERTKMRDAQMQALTETLSELRERLASIESGVKYLTETRGGRR